MMALAKELSRLYPDVIEAGGLANALQAALRAHGSPHIVRERPVSVDVACVRVDGEHRRCQAYVLEQQRRFVFDLWSAQEDRSIVVGALTESLLDVGARVHKWLGATCSAAEAVNGLERVSVDDDGIAYSARDDIDRKWRDMLEVTAYPALLQEALEREKLRVLLPYGYFYLGFSRCTRFPFTSGIPTAWPSGHGRFTVIDEFPNVTGHGHVLGHGDAAWAADVIEAYVPSDFGAAVSGTRESLPPLSD